jgi:methionyl-tRNA formyltransferase
MSSSNPLLFFGSDNFSAAVLNELLRAGVSIANIVTTPIRPSGRGRKFIENPIQKIAKTHSISLVAPDKLKNIEPQTINPQGLPMAVLASYGKIIPPAILETFKIGIINVHPSLLPRWRGPSPIETTLLNGDDQTGVTIMKLSAKMDEGPIYSSQSLKLSGAETQPELYEKLAVLGGQLLVRGLASIISGRLKPKEQSSIGVTYSKMIYKTDGWINWNKPAVDIERQIRAFITWPKSKTKLFDKEIEILRAIVVKSDKELPGNPIDMPGKLVIQCAKDALQIVQLKPAGKNAMSAQEFMRGYQR